jgi:hypothetical protein
LDGWNNQLGKSLSFSLSEYEPAPSGGSRYVTLDISAQSGAFRGASACVLAEQDLKTFLDGWEQLATGQRSDAGLVGGWGADEDVRIELFASNRRGHIGIRALIAEVPNSEQRDRLEVQFQTEPAPLLRFVEDIRRALAARVVTTVALYVVGGPAG